MTDHLKDPQAVSWEDLTEEFSFTDAEKHRIQKGVQALVLASGVHRLAELRKRQHTTQVQVAEVMGVTQARVSHIEKGQLERSEVDTLAAYVKALGGKLKIVADFGDETYVLG
ncbi:XRE family transcriptional regulator [Streptomyces sp. NPDC005791]|uniref:XRE family transcriptional regulator n=1 Tax=Streptomyces sp. NPDC005791 TaxID=3364732 RepID=UPI00368F695F